jgi:carbon storage regulator
VISHLRLAGEAPDVLVLTRKSNQSIMIGDEIEISVLAVMGEKVRIGIQAPRSVPVFRKEVYIEIQQDRNPSVESQQVDEALDRLKSPGGRDGA